MKFAFVIAAVLVASSALAQVPARPAPRPAPPVPRPQYPDRPAPPAPAPGRWDRIRLPFDHKPAPAVSIEECLPNTWVSVGSVGFAGGGYNRGERRDFIFQERTRTQIFQKCMDTIRFRSAITELVVNGVDLMRVPRELPGPRRNRDLRDARIRKACEVIAEESVAVCSNELVATPRSVTGYRSFGAMTGVRDNATYYRRDEQVSSEFDFRRRDPDRLFRACLRFMRANNIVRVDQIEVNGVFYPLPVNLQPEQACEIIKEDALVWTYAVGQDGRVADWGDDNQDDL